MPVSSRDRACARAGPNGARGMNPSVACGRGCFCRDSVRAALPLRPITPTPKAQQASQLPPTAFGTVDRRQRQLVQLALPLAVPVPSRSHVGEHYLVETCPARCTCASFVHRGVCRHTIEADVAAIFGPGNR